MLLTKRPKALAFLCVAITYAFMVNINLSRRARAIEEERERRLATDLGGGQCKLTPPSKVVSDENSTKTLLASFPGSGKRFAYEVIEGLTDHAAGDDWNFSGHDDALHVKSSYPHHEGTWTWGDKMDQMIMLLRNPRWALPSYHTMRFELDFSESWAQSYARIPYVYTVRPAVAQWETWREENFATEMDNWVNFINFWMDGMEKTISNLICIGMNRRQSARNLISSHTFSVSLLLIFITRWDKSRRYNRCSLPSRSWLQS